MAEIIRKYCVISLNKITPISIASCVGNDLCCQQSWYWRWRWQWQCWKLWWWWQWCWWYLTVFMMKVNSRYLAIRGSTREVGGWNHCHHHHRHRHYHHDHLDHPQDNNDDITKIFETSNRNTTSERRMEMPNVTFSPAWYYHADNMIISLILSWSTWS